MKATPLRVYNSLTHHKDVFSPAASDWVKMFVCGPTVYEYAHLGHARTYLTFDIITRYLKFLGYKVNYLMNITDVAERIVQRAQQLKRDPFDIAKEFETAFLEDIRALGISDISRFERASDSIQKMIGQVQGLIDKAVAYETETGVYFEVNKYPRFGQLSGLTLDDLGLRRLELCSSKHHPEDFSLWRKYEEGLAWDSPWGRGRPGWHIEDTAVSMSTFGDTYDVHGGASELIFPHHEAEIAQAESLTGKHPFVKYWIHTGLLNVGGRKMSKSLGNVIRIRDALKDHTGAELRFYFASVPFRDPMTFSFNGLNKAANRLSKLRKNFDIFTNAQPKAHTNAKPSPKLRSYDVAFRRNINDNFYTPGALTVLEHFARDLAKKASKCDEQAKGELDATFRSIANVLGILP